MGCLAQIYNTLSLAKLYVAFTVCMMFTGLGDSSLVYLTFWDLGLWKKPSLSLYGVIMTLALKQHASRVLSTFCVLHTFMITR